MEKKIQWFQGREQLAAFLLEMAEGVRRGELPWGGHAIEVPEPLETRLSLKLKKHGGSCKIEWRLGSSEERETTEASKRYARPFADFKPMKRELARVFRELKQAVQKGDMPDNRLLDAFERLSRAFAAQAEPPWDHAALEYLGHMENLLRSAREGRREAVIHEIQDLQTRMVNCHRDYK